MSSGVMSMNGNAFVSSKRLASLVSFAVEIAGEVSTSPLEAAYVESFTKQAHSMFPGYDISIEEDFPTNAEKAFWSKVFREVASRIEAQTLGNPDPPHEWRMSAQADATRISELLLHGAGAARGSASTLCLVMDHISTINYQPGFATAPCTWIAVNGTPIEKWCAEAFSYPDAITLGLAQMWLVDEDEDRLACSRLTPGEENSSTIVPILVCSDDMDFSCTVIVVEQLISNQTVQWLRWGFSASWGMEVGISTKWERPQKTPLAIFEREEFEACVRSFNRSSSD